MFENFLAKTYLYSTVSYKQHFDKLNADVFDFSDGLRTEDVPKVEFGKNKNLFVFELNIKNGKPEV